MRGSTRSDVSITSRLSPLASRLKKNMKTALITGVTGQDGSYLSEFLLDKGYEVHGIIRRSSVDYRVLLQGNLGEEVPLCCV